LTVLALAAQFAISFGHMHRDDLGLPPLAAAHLIRVAYDATHTPAVPNDRDHYPASNDPCSICASIVLLAMGAASLPPTTCMPLPVRSVWSVPAPVQAAATQLTLSFQARAPPVV
jgi:hypothetical protein